MRNSTLIVVTFTIALAAGCKKDEKPADPQPTPGSGTAMVDPGSGAGSAAGSAMVDPGSAAGSAVATAPADKLVIGADHADKTKGPVEVVFTGVKVVKADFDPAKIEGGTAELEVDLNTLSSGVEKRDAHLKSADYIDTTKFATLHVKVDNVKKTGDKTFTGDATVKLRDIEKKYPVTFTVVDAKDDWIRIEGESKFSRLDFKVGKEKDDGAAPELTAKLHLTLKKS